MNAHRGLRARSMVRWPACLALAVMAAVVVAAPAEESDPCRASENACGAVFNPFTGPSPVAAPTGSSKPDLPDADWTLPLLATAAGFVGVGALVREVLR